MAAPVKLLGAWASAFSQRIELALKLKGIEYEYVEEDLSNKSPFPLLLEYNPVHKKIPVLVHRGKPIAESLVILEYIEDTWSNNPVLPKDPYDRAIARFWAKFVDETILQLVIKARDTPDEEEKKKIFAEVGEQLKVLDKELQGKEFFGGETIGYLDIVVFFIAYWFQVGQEVIGVAIVTEEKLPNLWKWTGKLLNIDLVKASLPPRDKYFAFFKARYEGAKSASK
ncbi:hypothetical protein K2173_016830 [Erythroxylum novogranatense]|uniref:glutathione transferase n=1 Tax=Erythroxylum novogranatense TaxID=1862640 RepID=A0AAV8SHP3_9ROSI|nr:hypothetical protein K2173_016830 [Erythroxylum novogranatense]